MNKDLFTHNIVMCNPEYYSVKYRINPWMNPDENKSDFFLALDQWYNLYYTVIRLGGWVDLINEVSDLPDMVFSANYGLSYKNNIVISNFKHEERKKEAYIAQEYFKSNKKNYGLENIHTMWDLAKKYDSPVYEFEGAGDALFAGDLLFCGYGFRTNKNAYYYILNALNVEKYVMCKLVNDRFYHLDTCFCPLDSENALIYPKAFSEESLLSMASKINLHSVSESDALKFACNSIVLGKNVIIPSGCEDTQSILEKLGYNSYAVDMSEFIKAGGACKCCTLTLSNI